MNTNTLPRRFFVPVGYRKDGRPIFPIAGGSEPPNQPPATPPADPPATPPADPPGPVEAVDENGIGLGFPKDTKVDEMTDAQKIAYWRNQTKVANKRVPSNLSELEENARKWAEFQQSQQTPAEQQIAQVRKETEDRVRREAATDGANSLLRVTLQQRGKSASEIDEILEPISAEKFLTTEGKVDTGRVLAFVDKLAPASSGGGGNSGFGQGRGFGQSPTSKAEAGRVEAQRRGYGGLKKENA